MRLALLSCWDVGLHRHPCQCSNGGEVQGRGGRREEEEGGL